MNWRNTFFQPGNALAVSGQDGANFFQFLSDLFKLAIDFAKLAVHVAAQIIEALVLVKDGNDQRDDDRQRDLNELTVEQGSHGICPEYNRSPV